MTDDWELAADAATTAPAKKQWEGEDAPEPDVVTQVRAPPVVKKKALSAAKIKAKMAELERESRPKDAKSAYVVVCCFLLGTHPHPVLHTNRSKRGCKRNRARRMLRRSLVPT